VFQSVNMVVVCTFGAFCLSLFHHFDRLCFFLAAVKLGEVKSWWNVMRVKCQWIHQLSKCLARSGV